MSQNKSKSPQEASWTFIQIFYFIKNSLYSIYAWLFPPMMIFEDNEAGILMRRHLENKDFFGRLSSGWVELNFGYKLLIVCSVSLTSGLIGIALGAPAICALFALVVMVGIHTLLVAHEHHRRTQAKLMVEQVLSVQKDLEAQKEFFEKAHEKVCDAAEQLEECIDEMEKERGEVKQEVTEIKQQKEELVEVIEQVDLLVEEVIETQNELTVKIDESKEEMKQLDEAIDKGTESFKQFSETVSTFETSVDGFVDTQKKYAQAVSEFGIFVTQQREKSNVEDAVEYDDKLKHLIEMLDDANNWMDGLISESPRVG